MRSIVIGPTLVLTVACSGGGAELSPTAVLDSLPEWNFEIVQSIGLGEGPEDDLVGPRFIGVDSSHSVYIHDYGREQTLRFTAAGLFVNVVAARGEGPGQFRLIPNSIGVDAESVWHSESARGLIHWVSPDGKLLRTEETRLTGERFSPGRFAIIDRFANGDYLLSVTGDIPRDGSVLLPRRRLYYVRASANGQEVDTLYSYERGGGTLVLDGGRTSVTYPGPDDGPIVLYLVDAERILRVDRPWSSSRTQAVATLQWLDAHGTEVHRRDLAFSAVEFTGQARDSMRARVFNAAKLGGRRALSRESEATLRIMTTWPSYYPAVEGASARDDGTIWLRRPDVQLGARTEWIVVDSLFTPIARAYFPPGTSDITWDGTDSWTSLQSRGGEPFVARLRRR